MVYITVRYGESQQEIFNPNCKTNLLLKSIKRKCKCEREADIELSDESGNIKNLRDPGLQNKYANEFLDEREKFILLKVERVLGDGAHISYRPLLQSDDGVLSDDFLARLAVKGSEQLNDGRRAKSNTRRKEKPTAEPKEIGRQSSREKSSEKSKSTKNDKRLSARSKR